MSPSDIIIIILLAAVIIYAIFRYVSALKKGKCPGCKGKCNCGVCKNKKK